MKINIKNIILIVCLVLGVVLVVLSVLELIHISLGLLSPVFAVIGFGVKNGSAHKPQLDQIIKHQEKCEKNQKKIITLGNDYINRQENK